MKPVTVTIVLCAAMAFTVTACSSDGRLTGSGERSGTATNDCTSEYDVLARAATRKSLDQKLLSEVDRRVVRIEVRGPGEAEVPVDGPVEVVALVTRRGRTAIYADVFRQPDGRWFAGQWSQCTDWRRRGP